MIRAYLVVCLVTLGCTTDAAAAAEPAATRLTIPARKHAPGHPPEGWCGETAIQEALLYYGAFVPQRTINRAGKPTMPDLYARDIPVAMRALGMSFRWWRNTGDIHAFIAWIKRQVAAGRPVLAGVKINPTEHPEWGLDHFVLVVGYDRRGLLLNTTWGRRERRSYADLNSRRKGFSFLNRSRRYYALVIDGRRDAHATALPVQLVPRSETARTLEATLTARGLTPGKRYELRRYSSADKRAIVVERFIAGASARTRRIRLDKRHATFFAVAPARLSRAP